MTNTVFIEDSINIVKISKRALGNIIKESVSKALTERQFNPRDKNNRIRLVDDPNIPHGKDWAKKGGNFPIERNGQTFYVSRSSSVSLYAFAKDKNGNWYVLANKRGNNPGKGLYAVIIGYLNMAKSGEPEETLEMAACREAYEENGVKINPRGLILNNINSQGHNVHHTYYTVISDRTIEQMPVNTSGSEKNEVLDARWIPLSDLDKFNFAFNQASKIKAIAKKAIGDSDNNSLNSLFIALKNHIGADQEGQQILDKIISIVNRDNHG